ncbi:MAG: response regulator [Magnetococcus sp. WYHC-3]
MSINNRILVLDDDAELRSAYQRILQSPETGPATSRLNAFLGNDPASGDAPAAPALPPEEGGILDFKVTTASQGDEGVEMVRKGLADNRPFAMAFVDIRMPPGIDGLEAARRIRELDPSIYIIIVTAYSDRSIEEIQRGLRHDVVLARKPLNRDEIFQMARNACISWQRDRELELRNQSLESLNRRLNEQMAVFNKFVPRNFLQILDNDTHRDHIALGECQERQMTVMFSDIRSFTSFSESITPADNFRFINSYLGHMGPIIRKHDGFVDKYLGDGIMALFEEPENAVRTAIEMSLRLHQYNAGRRRAGYVPIAIGVGVNIGPVMLGTIGESDRLNTTVIGDTVNLAARTESLTKVYGTPVLLSEPAFKALHDPTAEFHYRLVDFARVKGKSTPMAFYEVLDGYPDSQRDARMAVALRYEEGVQLYHRQQIDAACQCFQDCLVLCPEDVPTRIFLQRCWGMANRYTASVE